MAGRDVRPDEAAAALNPSLRALMPDPSSLRGMDDAAEMLADCVEAGATIGLFGDYDVDGAASCAILGRWLHALGCDVHIHIPDRITEGYGPNAPAIEALAAHGIDLLITLDCGATSHEALAHAKGIGLSVLVLDHHQMRDLGPPVDALVNPNRPDDVSGLGHLCAAGVTFMALVAANRSLRARQRSDLPDLLGLLDCVGLATVADVVPLIGLNRAFVVQGLKMARKANNPGLSALVTRANLQTALQAFHFGYVLGPRINAGGRIGDAAMGARLLATDDLEEAASIADELTTLNAQRQALEAEAVDAAIAMIESNEADAPVLFVRDETWHPGVAGLIAARLKERFHKPSVAFTRSSPNQWTGSARSVPGVDIGAAVHAALEAGQIVKGGGHAMAAGLTLADDDWEDATRFLTETMQGAAQEHLAVRTLSIDAVLTATGASMELVAALEGIEPFGQGFPEPIFAFASHVVRKASPVGTNHVKATLADGAGGIVDAIAFRAVGTQLGDALLQARDGAPLHIAATVSRNSWQGRDTPQLRVVDAALPHR